MGEGSSQGVIKKADYDALQAEGRSRPNVEAPVVGEAPPAEEAVKEEAPPAEAVHDEGHSEEKKSEE